MADEHLISLQPGTVIAGRYEVVKCLGAGSMGLVYACRHRELSGHMVAVKVLFPEVAQDKIAAARFRNEIFASYGVSHPSVVRAYEYLRDGDLVAYTMEYVGGGDLADRLGRPDDLMPIAEVIKLLTQMCSGVQAIHDAGIVHRDLKPENILITKEGNVKITDFGIARTGHGPRLTEHGGVVGTIDYVSPEYMMNSQVDWRSDIYALGILGYEMTTGESPFRGDSVYATMTKRLKSDPKPLTAIRKDCPAELNRVILRAMERDPEKRWQSAAEMFYSLNAINGGDEAVSSGAYLQMSRHSGSYVGPKVAPSLEGEGPMRLDEDDAPVPSSMAGQDTSRNLVEETGMVSEAEETQVWQSSGQGGSVRSTAREWAGNGNAVPSGRSSPPRSSVGMREAPSSAVLQGPRSRNVEADPLARGFQEEEQVVPTPEPARMDRVLASSGAGWGAPDRPRIQVNRSGVHMRSSTIDQERMRNLSRMADGVNRSRWVEAVKFVVAILIGVGLGLAFLELYIAGNSASNSITSE